MESLATLPELEARMGKTFATPTEQAQATAALADASDLARAFGNPMWGAEGAAVPAIVRVVVLAVAERRMRNPDGYVSEQAAEYMYRRETSAAAGLAFTPIEERLLLKALGWGVLVCVPVQREVRIAAPTYYPYSEGEESPAEMGVPGEEP